MRVFQSVFLNDTLDHDTRDQKKVKCTTLEKVEWFLP